MPKRTRAVISSDHVDAHGHIMDRESLELMVTTINSKRNMIRMGVDHRRDFPPMGRLENAQLVERDGHLFVEADFAEYPNMKDVEWDDSLCMCSFDSAFQFSEVKTEEASQVSISVDKQNFETNERFLKFSNRVIPDPEMNVRFGFHARKSQIPDPEIIFGIPSSLLLYQLLKPAAKKLGEKIVDVFAEQASEKILKLITGAVKGAIEHCIPAARPVTFVFDFPGQPHVELIARTRNQEIVIKGLKQRNLKDIRLQVEDLSNYFKIAKIQFILSDKAKWKFNYLITESGDTVGKKIAFKKRDKRLQVIKSHKNL